MVLMVATPLAALIPCLVGSAADVPLTAEGFTVRIEPCDTEISGLRLRLTAPLAIAIDPPETVVVKGERQERLPFYNAQTAGWAKGAKLQGLVSQETTAAGRLHKDSVVLRLGAPDGEVMTPDKDYGIDLQWATFGRLPDGRIGEADAVFIDYVYEKSRLDSIVLTPDGRIALERGAADVAIPRPPALPEGAERISNVWVEGCITGLTRANLFPILEGTYPEPQPVTPSAAERLLSKTVAKLRSGEKLRVLAWGDSVTVGTYVPNWQANRWQEQFVARLQERFPKANIELTTCAWGGRSMQSFLSEPPGSEYNYKEKILGSGADLIAMEFVNDAGLDPAGVESLYSQRLEEFRAAGIEWAILTPHYVRPDWMGLTAERDCDEDPRPYVAGVRAFCAKHDVAMGDASLRWGHLWREGIPYTTLLMNAINHPDERGMKLFADALMALFPPS